MKQNHAHDRDVKIYTPLPRRIGQPPAMPQTDPEADEAISVWQPSCHMPEDAETGLIQ